MHISHTHTHTNKHTYIHTPYIHVTVDIKKGELWIIKKCLFTILATINNSNDFLFTIYSTYISHALHWFNFVCIYTMHII